MKRIITTIFHFLALNLLFAQMPHFKGTIASNYRSELDAHFNNAQAFYLNTERLKTHLQMDAKAPFLLSLGNLEWELYLESAHIVAPNVVTYIDGVESEMAQFDPSFKGFTKEGKAVRLTINNGFIAGILPLGDKEYFIEPSENEPTTYLLYSKEDIRSVPNHKCLAEEVAEKHESYSIDNQELAAGCVELELGIATDTKLYTKYQKSISSLENRVTGIINIVEGYYAQGDFNHDVKIVISTWFHATTIDPWGGSTSLSPFATWGAGGGMGNSYDLAQLWTGNTNLGGNVIGWGYFSGVCRTNTRYSMVVDSYENLLQSVLVAHELGHNFSLQHSSGIMASTINENAIWTTSSINQINIYLPTVIRDNCLKTISGCGNSGGSLPSANFDYIGINADTFICLNSAVTFQNTSSPDATSFRWTFEGGTPTTSTSPNPKVVFKNAGNYKATLYAKNSAGEKAISKIIKINTPVVPTFTYKVQGFTVIFSNSSPADANWLWKFENGKTSTEKNPTHTFANNGNFNVVLTATNKCGTRTVSKLVLVSNTTPAAIFSVDKMKGCLPLTVKTLNTSTISLSYQWITAGADITSSTDKEPTLNYSKSGTYDIILIAKNGNLSDTQLLKKAIVVKEKPIVNFSVSADKFGYATFQNQTLFADSLRWDFGDNETATDSIPLHFYAKSATYFVSLTAKNECGIVVKNDTLAVLFAPKASFKTDSNYIACDSVTVKPLNQSSSEASEFFWQTEGATKAFSLEKEPNITYSISGIYEILLIAKNAAGTDTTRQKINITVKEKPIALFADSISERSVWFKNQSKNGLKYHWNFGDGTTSDDENPNTLFSKDGTFHVTLKTINDCDTNTYVKTITIVTKPKAAFSFGIGNNCEPAEVKFKQEASDNVSTFQWFFEGGKPAQSNDPNPTIEYDKAGKFNVSLLVKNTLFSDSVFKKEIVEIKPQAKANFSESVTNSLVNFQNNSSFASSYKWIFGDGGESTEANPSHVYATSGTYEVKLEAENECSKGFFTKKIVLQIIDNQDIAINEGIAIFPYPHQGNFTILLKNETLLNATTILRNAIGQLVFQQTLSAPQQRFELDFLPKGFYILCIEKTTEKTKKCSFLKLRIE